MKVKMKKNYHTPVCCIVQLETISLLTASPENTYGDDRGSIRYNSVEISADDAD